MKNSFVLIRQFIAIAIIFWFYANVYTVGGEAGVDYGLPRQLVEIFLLVMLFYGVFFIGKVFVWYWRNVEPRPVVKEVSLILLFEYLYLPIVAVFFPLYIEGIFLDYKLEKQSVDNFLFVIPFLLFVLFDMNGGLRIFIYEQNMKIRNRSVLKMEDILNTGSSTIKRSSLIHYFIGFALIGVLSFY